MVRIWTKLAMQWKKSALIGVGAVMMIAFQNCSGGFNGTSAARIAAMSLGRSNHASASVPSKTADASISNVFRVEKSLACELRGGLQCGLEPGEWKVETGEDGVVTLTNRGTELIEIEEIRTVERSAEQNAFDKREVRVYLDPVVGTERLPPMGRGEVMSEVKAAGEKFEPIRWSAPGRDSALGVPAGSIVRIETKSLEPKHASRGPAVVSRTLPTSFILRVRSAQAAIMSARQPRRDESMECTGGRQRTARFPYRNNSGRSWFVGGAQVTLNHESGEVHGGCISILDQNDGVRWSHCHDLDRNGTTSFPPQEVRHGEAILAQAEASCIQGQRWSWSAFVHVWQ